MNSTKLTRFSWMALMLLIQACNHNNLPTNEIPKLADNNRDYSLSNWQIIGPFLTDSVFSNEAFGDYNVLRQYGIENDLALDGSNFHKVTQGYKDSIFQDTVMLNGRYSNEHGFIDFKRIFNTLKSGIAYAICNIESAEDQEAVLQVGSKNGFQIFLNGKNCFRYDKSTMKFTMNAGRVKLKLKKGDNNFVIKSAVRQKIPQDWWITCHLSSLNRYNSYFTGQEKNFLKRPVVPMFSPLELTDAFFPESRVTLSIVNSKGKTVDSRQFEHYPSRYPLPETLVPGLYQLVIDVDDYIFYQNFYYGDLPTAFDQLILQARQLVQQRKDIKLKHHLDALLKRYDLVKAHYAGDYECTIEVSHDSVDFKIAEQLEVISSRWIKLKPANYYRFSAKKKSKLPITALAFYRTISKKSNIDSLISSNQELLESLSDDNERTYFYPFRHPITFYFREEKELFVRITAYPNDFQKLYERRWVYLYKEIKELVEHFQQKQEYLAGSAGIHIKTFHSGPEKQPQYYIVNAPKSCVESQAPSPLVVALPVVYFNHLSFLKNHAAQMKNMEIRHLLSESYQCMTILPGARTYKYPNRTPIAENNVLAAIEDVKKEYQIDDRKIYLFAYCGGTPLALSLASHYPGKFAAVSIGNGVISKVGNDSEAPIHFTENLTNTPIYLDHVEMDWHSPIQSMIDYYDKAKTNGVPITFNIIKNIELEALIPLSSHNRMYEFYRDKKTPCPQNVTYSTAWNRYHKAFWLSVFPQKAGIKSHIKAEAKENRIDMTVQKAKQVIIYSREAPIDTTKTLQVSINEEVMDFKAPLPKQIILNLEKEQSHPSFQKNSFTEGPLMHALSDDFILVNGTIGGERQKPQSDSILHKFQTMWQSNYYTSCPVKSDIEVSAEDMKNSTLVLIGNQHTNGIIRRIYEKLPLKIEKDHIMLGQRLYTGNPLGYYLVYPNPLSPKKYIVLIGGNDLSKMPQREGNPAENGYFDFEIYERQKNLIATGNFNQFWRLE